MATVSNFFSSELLIVFGNLVRAVGIEIHQHEILEQGLGMSARGNMLAFIQWQLVQA